MSRHRYASGQGYVSFPQARRNRPKLPYIALEQFGESVAKIFRQPWSAQVKIGSVCRLARIYRELTPSEIAKTIGCARSRAYSLENGEYASLKCYSAYIAAVNLDEEALLKFASENVPPPEPKQAEALLLSASVPGKC
jgi:hypothetical protein